jgi:hypothetical protein
MKVGTHSQVCQIQSFAARYDYLGLVEILADLL